MFDILVASTPRHPPAESVLAALREARLRVIACEVGPGERPSSGIRVDAAVACAPTSPHVAGMAAGIRAAVDGPPPVLGVTRDAGSPPPGTVDVLRDDAPRSLLVARVERAALGFARRRSRTVLSGTIEGVGLRALIASLRGRGQTCVVKIAADNRVAEVVVDRGKVTFARADGVPRASTDLVLSTVEGWRSATFEVHGSVDRVPLDAATRPVDAQGGGPQHESDVALAVAVMNAVSAYARTFLPAIAVVRHLEQARDSARRLDPSVDAFEVSSGGLVSLARVEVAAAASTAALSTWCIAFFDACAQTMPSRFRRQQIGDALGGLGRLIAKAGWDQALVRGGGTS
jgi:hypothetical protein